VLRLEPLLLLLLRPGPLRLATVLRLAAGFFRPFALPDREALVRALVAAFGRLREEPLPELVRVLDVGLGFDPDLLVVARLVPRPLREVG
jgi:hypothetical protein